MLDAILVSYPFDLLHLPFSHCAKRPERFPSQLCLFGPFPFRIHVFTSLPKRPLVRRCLGDGLVSSTTAAVTTRRPNGH